MLVSLFYLHDHPLLDVLQLLIRKKELLTHLLHGPQPRRLLRVLRLRLGRLEEEPLGSPDQLRAVQANHHPVLQQAVRDVGGGGSGVGGAWLQQGEGVCSTTTHIGDLQHFDVLSTKITLDDSRSNLGFVFFPGKLVLWSDGILVSKTSSSAHENSQSQTGSPSLLPFLSNTMLSQGEKHLRIRFSSKALHLYFLFLSRK